MLEEFIKQGAEVFHIDMGDDVICDYCDEDYSNSDEEGGFLFGSYAVCPKCHPKAIERIIKNGEQSYVKAVCPAGWSFARFVREICR